MLHGNAFGVPSPVPETFRKRETAGNEPETFMRKGKRFTSNGNAGVETETSGGDKDSVKTTDDMKMRVVT
ncbi:hypothetical protein Tco_1532266 [Tanacetum coccineum]